MTARVDVAVSGVGPVGLACGLAARSLGLSVALIGETAPLAQGEFDGRVYALSPKTLAWLETIKVSVSGEPVQAMRVATGVDDRRPLLIKASEAHASALCHIVEHRALMGALLEAVARADITQVRGTLQSTQCNSRSRRISLESQAIDCDVLVVAEGVNSPTRTRLGLATKAFDYKQCAVVAPLKLLAPHRGEARQWFMPSGEVLALLPLRDQHAALVWSARSDHADALMHRAATDLTSAINEAINATLIAKVVGPASKLPLTLTQVEHWSAPCAVLVGDAAHSVHPLAGQGLNLGLADIKALQEAWRLASQKGLPISDGLVLARYARARAQDTRAVQLVTDGLWRVFRNSSATAKSARVNAFAIANALSPIRRMVTALALH